MTADIRGNVTVSYYLKKRELRDKTALVWLMSCLLVILVTFI